MRPNFIEKNNIRTTYLQIPCQTLSVIFMEIEGIVKLSENVHNIWISARKPVVCPQTRYCIRRNIVPKFLKNAMKTLFAFCVFNNGRISCKYTKRIKSVLFRSNAHKKIVAIFRVRIISFVHIKVEHSILRAPKSTPRSQGARMV